MIFRRCLLLLALICLALVGCEDTGTDGDDDRSHLAYIYSSGGSWAADYDQFLRDRGFRVSLVEMASIPTTDLSAFDLLVVDSRTGYQGTWGTTEALTAIEAGAKPILGLGFGGASLFQELGVSISWQHGWVDLDTGRGISTWIPLRKFVNSPMEG